MHGKKWMSGFLLSIIILHSFDARSSRAQSNNKRILLATSSDNNIQSSISTVDKIYHVQGALGVVDKKIERAKAGQLSSVEKAALAIWTVTYLNNTLLHVGEKTQVQCDKDVRSITNEMICPWLPIFCCRQSTAVLIRKEVEDCLINLHAMQH